MKFLIIIAICIQSTFVFAISKSLKVDVELSPAGSFQITSKRIKGKVVISGQSFTALNIKIPIKSLKTGVSLRDHHLQKKLGIESNSKAALILISASGQNGIGEASFKVLNKIQKTKLTYKILSKKLAQATFKLSLKNFGIDGISYMGIGVQDLITINIIIPIKKNKK